MGFTRIHYETLNRDVYRLNLPWCAEHASTKEFGAESWILLAQQAGSPDDAPIWGFGFFYKNSNLDAEVGTTMTCRMLQTKADFEQLLFGLGYEIDYANDDEDPEVKQLLETMHVAGYPFTEAYRYSLDVIRLRIEDSRFQPLSYDGRRALINSVLNTVPGFKEQVSVFLLVSPGETAADKRLARLDYNFKNRRPAMARMPGED